MPALLRDYRFWLILLLAVAVRCWHLSYRSLSGDEGYSLMLSQFAPHEIIEYTARDVHPPLYYLMLHGWLKLVGHSVAGVRLLSVIPGVAGVFIQALLMQVLVGRRAALLAALLLAVAPFLVRYSQDVRMYSWLALWLWTATLVLVVWLRAPARWAWLVLYTALMTAALYTHYFAGLALVTHWAYLLWLRLRRGRPEVGAPAWWAATGMIAVLFVPWLPSLSAQLQHTGQSLGWLPAITAGTVPELVWKFTVVTDARALPTLFWLAWPLLGAGLAIALVVRERTALEPAALLLAAVGVPMLVAGLISLKVPLLYPRYLIYAAGALPLWVAIALDRAMPHFKVGALTGLGLWLGVSSVGVNKVFDARERIDIDQRPEDHSIVLAELINTRYRPGDEVFIASSYDYSRVFFYLRPEVRLRLFAPDSMPSSLGSQALFYRDSAQTVAVSLQDMPDATCRLWWVALGADGNGPVRGREPWRLVERFQPNLLTVWLYVRDGAPGNACADPP
ncbi:glycosyltransferase family 39 protein [Pseudomonas putida]